MRRQTQVVRQAPVRATVAQVQTVPRGGVQAGAGGTAPVPGDSGDLLLLGGGSLLLMAGGAGLLARARRSEL